MDTNVQSNANIGEILLSLSSFKMTMKYFVMCVKAVEIVLAVSANHSDIPVDFP